MHWRWLTLAGLCTLLLSACAPTADLALSISGLGWSERLRPDLEPLDSAQRVATLSTFSDGGADGTRLVSPLYPDIPEVAAGTMQAAPVLWVSQGTPLRLSYEAIFLNPLINGARLGATNTPYGNTVANPSPLLRQAAVSARGVTVPIERRFAVFLNNGNPRILNAGLIGPAFFGYAGFVGVAVERCVLQGSPYNEAGLPPPDLFTTCARTLVDRNLCTGPLFGSSQLPATVLRCQLTLGADSVLRLVFVDPRFGNLPDTTMFPGAAQPSLPLPYVKVVAFPRRLGRPAPFLREECKAPDPAGGERDCNQAELANLVLWRRCNGVPQAVPPGTVFGRCPQTLLSRQGLSPQGFSSLTRLWSFSVADAATGRFAENFGPGISIRRVKFLVRSDARPGEQGRFLSNGGDPATRDNVEELRMVQSTGGGVRINNIACPVTAEPVTGNAMADLASCPQLAALRPNPAWAAGNPENPIEWRLVLRQRAETVEAGQICNPNCQPVLATGVLRRDLPLNAEAGDRVTMVFDIE